MKQGSARRASRGAGALFPVLTILGVAGLAMLFGLSVVFALQAAY